LPRRRLVADALAFTALRRAFVTAFNYFAAFVFADSARARLEIGNAIVLERLGALAAIIICGSGRLSVLALYSNASHRLRRRVLRTAARGDSGAAWRDVLPALVGHLMTLFLGLEWFLARALRPSSRSTCIRGIVENRPARTYRPARIGFLCLRFRSASALRYGATGHSSFEDRRQRALPPTVCSCAGLAMMIVGLGYQALLAPFHHGHQMSTRATHARDRVHGGATSRSALVESSRL